MTLKRKKKFGGLRLARSSMAGSCKGRAMQYTSWAHFAWFEDRTVAPAPAKTASGAIHLFYCFGGEQLSPKGGAGAGGEPRHNRRPLVWWQTRCIYCGISGSPDSKDSAARRVTPRRPRPSSPASALRSLTPACAGPPDQKSRGFRP